MRPLASLVPLLPAAIAAAAAFAARLPFVISAKIPFDSDEAVEGLMARHVLGGELPAFLWGQAFKGVPEVYAAAGAFALFGSSVATLKLTTLLLFAMYAGAHFVLLDRLSSRWIAVASTLLLIFSPPALVFWSLDASAEFVVIMFLGTALLLVALDDPKGGGSNVRPPNFAVGLIAGLGLWVHALFVIYLIPLAVIAGRQHRFWTVLAQRRPNAVTFIIGSVAAVYLVLALFAFFTGGFTVQSGRLAISATAPQKLLRIAAAAMAVSVATHLALRSARGALARRYWPAAAGFLVGFSPALLYSVLVEPARSPARSADVFQLASAWPDMAGNIVPIIAGFKIATTERLAIPWIAALPGAAAVGAYLWFHRGRLTSDFFALFVVFVPFLFLASGVYLDTQSYRYLVPWYAGLAVAWAAGSLALSRGNRLAAAAVTAAIIGTHIWQQLLWYEKLQPDRASMATIECLRNRGIRGGFGDYWTAYKLTFLADERIIIAPVNGVDRYPAYTAFVRGLPPHERMDDVAQCN